MNYEDATLIRLANLAFRDRLFDPIAMEQLIAATYDADGLNTEAPYQLIFDRLQLGFAVPKLGKLEGILRPIGGNEQFEAKFQISGIGNNDLIRVDALWEGAIVARVVSPTSKITQVVTNWAELSSIDTEIESNLGNLPSDLNLLEQERRTRLLGKIKAGFNDPESFTEEALNQWLKRAGATSVSDLITNFPGVVQGGAVQVSFSPPDPSPPSPKRLPIIAAILIRDIGFSIAQLLMDSKLIREQLESFSFESSPAPELKPRYPIVIIWVIPVSVFDDENWPGGSEEMDAEALRTARRTVAGEWLAGEGIGLVVTN